MPLRRLFHLAPVLAPALALAGALAFGAVHGAAPAAASPELARAKNCVACHLAERRMVGPPYKDIAARYANDSGAVARLVEKVRAGGAGSFGAMPMPAQNVTPEEAETLVKWILSHQ